MNKILPLASVAIISFAILFSLDCMDPARETIVNLIQRTLFFNPSSIPKVKVFSKEELAKYKGENGGRVYLAIVGKVFDVSKGKRHYGPGGGYEFFSGIDGSKAFVTGKFDKEGLVDDISDFTNSDILSLDNWMSFYEKDYSYVGVVEGSFYNKDGKEGEMMTIYKQKLDVALKEKSLIETDRKLFPPCNSEWSQNNGARVWCSNKSGGIKRSWEGIPRMYFTAGSSKPRCACIRQTGPPSHDPKSGNHKDRGDLDNPNLSVYPDCDPTANSCFMKE